MKYLVPQRTNRTHFLSLPLDLISILISSLCSKYNKATLWRIQRGMLLLNVFCSQVSFQRTALIQRQSEAHKSTAVEFRDCLGLSRICVMCTVSCGSIWRIKSASKSLDISGNITYFTELYCLKTEICFVLSQYLLWQMDVWIFIFVCKCFIFLPFNKFSEIQTTSCLTFTLLPDADASRQLSPQIEGSGGSAR